MHRCLRVEELLRAILEEVRHDPEDSEDEWDWDLQTIYGLARTCKTFLGPALDLIWHTHYDLSNLTGTLPTSAWTLDEKGNRLVRSNHT